MTPGTHLRSLTLLVLLASSLAAQEIPITTSSEEARALYIQARDLGERVRSSEAKPLLEQAIAKDSTFALAYLELASGQQSISDMRAFVAKALACSEKASPAERMLIQAAQARLDNNSGKEKELREKLAELFPADKRVLYNLGLYYQFFDGNIEASIQPFKKAIKIDSQYHPAYNNLGYAYSSLGKYDEAEQTLKKYVELIPAEANPHDTYAEVLMKQGKISESIVEYKKSLAIDPTFYYSHIGLGTNYVFLGRGGEGRTQFKKLFDISANALERYQAIEAAARSYLIERKFENAVQELEHESALALQMKDTAIAAVAAAAVVEILAEAGKTKEAESKLMRAKKLVFQPTSYGEMNVLHAEITLALSRARTDDARATLAEYKKRAETSANGNQLKESHSLAGRIALKQKRYDDALTELQQADQRNAQTLFITAQVYAAKGDKAKAKEFMSKAANFNDMSWAYALVRKKAKEELAKLK